MAWQRDGFDVLKYMNGKIHWLTLPSQRSDIGSPKIIGFIRTASQLHKFFQVLTIK